MLAHPPLLVVVFALTTACAVGPLRADEGRAPGAAPEPDPDAVALAREVVADDAFQKELLPADEDADRSGLTVPEGTGAVLGTLGRVVLYAFLAVAITLVVLWLVAFARERFGAEARAPSTATAAAPVRAWRAPSLAEAERLAAAGAFAAAVHALLLIAVERLAAAREVAPPPSLTSRELSRTLTPAPRERDPFLVLVRAVEVSHFGGHALDADDWHRCRAAIGALVAQADAGSTTSPDARPAGGGADA